MPVDPTVMVGASRAHFRYDDLCRLADLLMRLDAPPSCPRGHSAPSGASYRHCGAISRRRTPRNVLERLSGVNEPSTIILMTTTRHAQQRYDHRLRDLVRGTGDVTIATGLGVPRSTVRGWLDKAPRVVITLDVTNLQTSELQQEIVALRRRVRKLTALLRLALALLRSSGFTLAHERLPEGRAKIGILRAVDRAREFLPLRGVLRFLRLSPSRFHAWQRLQHACALDDQLSCPRTSPHRQPLEDIARGWPPCDGRRQCRQLALEDAECPCGQLRMPRNTAEGLSTDRLKDLARRGAEMVLKQLRAEIVAIERTFPELGLATRRPAIRRSLKTATNRTQRMSAAARAAVSARMKKYWAERRKARARATK